MTLTPLTKVTGPPVACADCPIRARALFQVVSDDYIHQAQASRRGQYRLKARRHLYREGDPLPLAFTLFDGWMLLYRVARKGGRQGLKVALPGDFIGYQSIGADGVNHAAQAITDCTLCGFEHDTLRGMLYERPHLAVHMTQVQSNDMAACQEQVLGLGRKRAEARIAHLMLDIYTRLQQRGAADGNRIDFPLTQEVIGDLTGNTVVHTNRVLQKLRAEGLVECGGHRLLIKDEARLREVAQFDGDRSRP